MVIIFQCKIIKLNVIIIISSTLVKRMEETNQQVKSGRGFFFFLNCCSVFCFLFLLSKLFVPPAPLDGCICHTKKKGVGVGHCFVYYFSIWFILVLICIAAMMMIISTLFYFWKYFDIRTQKKIVKSPTSCFLLLSRFFFFIFRYLYSPTVIFERLNIWPRKNLSPPCYIFSIFSTTKKKKKKKNNGDWWWDGGRWPGTFHLFDTWHRAHRISDSR